MPSRPLRHPVASVNRRLECRIAELEKRQEAYPLIDEELLE